MIAQLQNAVLRRISATGAEKALDEIPDLLRAYPHVRTWKQDDLGHHWGTLMETDTHLRGEAYEDLKSYADHTIAVPLHESGKFKEERCCVCRTRAAEDLITLAEFPPRFTELSLDELDPSTAKEAAKEYLVEYFMKAPQGHGLLFAGPVGTGKTQLAVSLGMELVRKYLIRARFLTVEEFMKQARDFREPARREDIETTDLLILDDLGRTPLSAREIPLVSGLIDLRYSHKLPVMVTTNLSRADLSERVGIQIVSRLWESCTRVTTNGIDRRMGGKHTDVAQLTA